MHNLWPRFIVSLPQPRLSINSLRFMVIYPIRRIMLVFHPRACGVPAAGILGKRSTSRENQMLFAIDLENTPSFVEQHSGALTILVLSALIMGTLLILVPQLLRSHQRTLEMMHTEHMKTLEQGLPMVPSDDRSLAPGRVATPGAVVGSASAVP